MGKTSSSMDSKTKTSSQGEREREKIAFLPPPPPPVLRLTDRRYSPGVSFISCSSHQCLYDNRARAEKYYTRLHYTQRSFWKFLSPLSVLAAPPPHLQIPSTHTQAAVICCEFIKMTRASGGHGRGIDTSILEPISLRVMTFLLSGNNICEVKVCN